MTTIGYFRVNKPKIIFEGFEDEVVLINLENGNYYSLEGSAAFIWNLIQSGTHINDIRVNLGGIYIDHNQELEKEADRFIDELIREELILASDNPDCESIPKSDEKASNESLIDKIPFVLPVLNRYTDMQDLLLLDPIHEVDESGWPIIPSEGSSGI